MEREKSNHLMKVTSQLHTPITSSRAMMALTMGVDCMNRCVIDMLVISAAAFGSTGNSDK